MDAGDTQEYYALAYVPEVPTVDITFGQFPSFEGVAHG